MPQPGATLPTREAAFSALWALTAGVSWVPDPAHPLVTRTWVTRNRRSKLFADVAAGQQPAIFQWEHGEQIAQKTKMPYRRMWYAKWLVYQITASDDAVAGGIENNMILDALQAAIAPRPTDPGFNDERNTLGGLVWHCFFDGEIFKDPGDIDAQAMMVIPVTMLVP